MNLQLFLLIIVVITALAFDYTNGFHDTGNAMATDKEIRIAHQSIYHSERYPSHIEISVAEKLPEARFGPTR